MQTTKQKVWQLAKQHELDDFIAKVAKTFPDALEIVHVQTRNENAWCYAGKRNNDGVQQTHNHHCFHSYHHPTFNPPCAGSFLSVLN
ncbi:hypothetical protein UA63_004849 [Salmonella enterica subsp. enterica serovar 4,5:i:-]|nr:hypothetical protein [Salmonella enterica subsp. enterica serovar 4,5:i:-]